jgi:spore germination protein YaaH
VLLPGEGRIEYGKFGSLADLVVIQLYDDGDNNPGPISRDSWWRRVIAERSNEIPADKLVFACASMGRDWTRLAEDGVSDFMSFGAIMRAAAMQHATIQFDAPSLNPHFSYYESSGAAHDIWFLDAATAFNQITPPSPSLASNRATRKAGKAGRSLDPRANSSIGPCWKLASTETACT